MKTVFNNEMVAHVWAQQNQREGKSGNGQFYFEGKTIYSYGRHFPVATFAETKAKERVVLFNTNGYSPTTGKHKFYVRRALPLGATIFYVDNPTDSPEANARAMTRFIERSTLALGGMRKSRKRDELQQSIIDAYATRNTFGKAFIKGYRTAKPPADLLAASAKAQAEQAEKNKADEIARLARYEQQVCECETVLGVRRGAWADLWRRGGPDLGVTDNGNLTHAWYGARNWLSQNIGVLLRVDGDNIFTSKGAEFPASHGLKALPLIRRVVKSGEAWEKNGHQIHLGHFQIDRIETDGMVKAGCHTVAYSEIEAVAAILEGKAV